MTKNKGGRPTNFTPELGDRICHLIATHPLGYDPIRKMYPELPCPQLVREWRQRFPEFNAKYLDAKRFQAEIMVEEIDSMLPEDIKTYVDDKGNERVDAPTASMMIAKINNRKWMAARLAPRRYGDAQRVEELEGQNDSLKLELLSLRAELDAKNKKDF